MLLKLTKSVRNCQHPILWRNHQNWNLSFRNFLLKYEPRIKDNELHGKEQKIYTNFFYFHIFYFDIYFYIFSDSRSFKKRCQKKVVRSPSTPCFQFSLIRENYFYGVHRYFLILSIEKFYDVVMYWYRLFCAYRL